MAKTAAEVVQALRSSEFIYYLNSAATNLPFVVCDEESFNDQVWLFPDEKGVKAFFEKYKAQKYPLMGKKFEQKNLGNYFFQLRLIGVNTIVWCEGDEISEVDIDEIAPMPKLSEEEQKKIPPMNPTLQLSGIYFMQEMRRQLTLEEHAANGMRDLEEELLVNVCKSTFFMLLRQDPDDEQKVGPLLMKGKEDKLFQPYFTDTMEMNKFVGQQKDQLRVVRVPFAKFTELVPEQVEGVVINPAGFKLALSKDQIQKLIGAEAQEQ